jgi:RNA polymerase sigma-70 factor (ECF subfamily)
MNQARSRAIDRVRYEHRKKRVSSDVESPDVALTRGPQESFDAEEQARLLRQAVALLAPQEREAIETAYFGELTYPEVAARLDQPLGTVKTRIRAGLGKLRQLLAGRLKGL